MHSISRFSFLSPVEASKWSDQVVDLSMHWLCRAKGVDFYTLGAAHYLDLNPYQSTDRYQTFVRRYNPILWKNFEPLYRHLLEFCSNQFEHPFAYHKELALPGFHIFGPKPKSPHKFFNSVYFSRGGSIHVHPIPRLLPSLLSMSKQELASSLYSLTIPLSLPASGGGLSVWNDSCKDTKSSFYPYQLGYMYGFEGSLKHQIAPVSLHYMDSVDSRRITIQCHLIDIDHVSYLFF